MRLPLIVAFVSLTAFALSGCSGSPGYGASGTVSSTVSASVGSTPSEAMVEMYDNYFEGGNRTIAAGSSIMYMNEGQHAHTVTIHWVGDPLTVTKLNQTLQPGQQITFEFDVPGTYHVWCRFHGQMTSGMASIVTVT